MSSSRCSADALAVIERLKETQRERREKLAKLRAAIERDLGYRHGQDGIPRLLPGGPRGPMKVRLQGPNILAKLAKLEAKAKKSEALVKQLEAACARPKSP